MDTLLSLLFFVLLSTSDATLCFVKQVPDQIRLAFAGDNGVSVGWHTYSCLLMSSNPNPNAMVIYGTSKTALTSASINGNSSFYDKDILRTSWFYYVELPNLSPSTIHYYQIMCLHHRFSRFDRLHS
jgi:hypothetical protein